MEARVEALMENLAMAVMQADHLAADARVQVLAETLAYALDLADLGLSAESGAFGSVRTIKSLVTTVAYCRMVSATLKGIDTHKSVYDETVSLGWRTR